MSHSAGDEVLVLLDSERAAFLAQVSRVSPARQAERRAPDRWSAAEVAEHLARIDMGVAKLLAMRTAEPVPGTPDQLAAAALTPEKIALVRSREVRIEAPERIRPSGTLSAEAALAQAAGARAALKAAYLATPPSVLDGAVHPHPVIGLLTLRSWVVFTAHHDARHADQVAELADGWEGQVPA